MFVINVCELGTGRNLTLLWAHSKGTDTTENKVSTYPTMDSTALLENLNMTFDSHLGSLIILDTREPDYTCVRSNNAHC
jgi:hypothetical protein